MAVASKICWRHDLYYIQTSLSICFWVSSFNRDTIKGKVHANNIEYNHYSHINRERCERDFILTVGVCSQLVKSVSLEFGVSFSHCELRVCEAAKEVWRQPPFGMYEINISSLDWEEFNYNILLVYFCGDGMMVSLDVLRDIAHITFIARGLLCLWSRQTFICTCDTSTI